MLCVAYHFSLYAIRNTQHKPIPNWANYLNTIPQCIQMSHKERAANQNAIIGCGLLGLLSIIGVVMAGWLILRHEAVALRYPNAVEIPSLARYKLQSTTAAQERAYRTPDPFPAVYNWYAGQFNATVSAIEQDIGSGCVLLEGTRQQFLVERYIFVSICETQGEQKIFVYYGLAVN